MSIFKRKQAAPAAGGNGPALRSRRDHEAASGGSNPLARRLLGDDDPDTIDLTGGAGFPANPDPSPEEPETRVAEAAEERRAEVRPGPRHPILGQDPETGKFYVQPGTDDCPVHLGDELVRAPTELRRGDRIRVGDAEFGFLL